MPLFHREDGVQAGEQTGARHETSMRGNKELLMGAEAAATGEKSSSLRETLSRVQKGGALVDPFVDSASYGRIRRQHCERVDIYPYRRFLTHYID